MKTVCIGSKEWQINEIVRDIKETTKMDYLRQIPKGQPFSSNCVKNTWENKRG